MNINKLFPSKYAKAHDLPESGVVVVMSHIKIEKMGQPPKDNAVLYFERASKGMVLNRTNAMIIASLYGPETDGWKGKRIRLYATWVKAFNKNNHVIRVDEQAPLSLPSNGNNGHHETAPEALNDAEDMVDADEYGDDDATPDYSQPEEDTAPVDKLSSDAADTQGDEPEGTPIQKAIKLAESVYGRKYGPRLAELIRLVSDQKTSSPAELDAEQQEALLQALLLRRTLNLKGAKKHGDGWPKFLHTRIRELSNNFMDNDSELTDEQVTVILKEL